MSLAGAAASLGVSAGVGSTIWAGVPGDDDDEAGLEVSDDFDDGSCGNLASASGDRASTTTLDLVAVALVVDILAEQRRCRRGRWRRGVEGGRW